MALRPDTISVAAFTLITSACPDRSVNNTRIHGQCRQDSSTRPPFWTTTQYGDKYNGCGTKLLDMFSLIYGMRGKHKQIPRSGRTKKKVVGGNDTEAPKAPRLRRRVLLHGGPQPQWGEIPRPPVIRALIPRACVTSVQRN